MSGCPLDPWIAGLCGLPDGRPDPAGVLAWQMEALRRAVRRAAARGPLYRERFAALPAAVREGLRRGVWPREPGDMALLPFTDPADLAGEGWRRLVCVSQDEVARMVTLHTSGTTGNRAGGQGGVKRLAFSERDLARTADFFAVGMGVLARPGDTVLILLPGAERPGGVADLLIRALARLGGGPAGDEPVCLGVAGNPAADPAEFAAELRRWKPACLVAAPSQLRRLLEADDVTRLTTGEETGYAGLRAVLASSEPLSPAGRADLARAWRCEVFDHYGLTESAYGGGVECASHDGFHWREADLWLEIVDPVTGRPLPAGRTGEVTLTTLTREALPLIRYRTGDVAAILPGPCRCGSPLRRLGRVVGRLVPDENGVRRVATPEKGKAHERDVDDYS